MQIVIMPTTVTQARGMDITTHCIDWNGISGAIFWITISSCIICILGFATTGWHIQGDIHQGLWEKCNCINHQNPPGNELINVNPPQSTPKEF